MALPHEAILGINISSALVDAFLYHSWPPATRDEENASTCAEEKLIPRIASCGKVTFSIELVVNFDQNLTSQSTCSNRTEKIEQKIESKIGC